MIFLSPPLTLSFIHSSICDNYIASGSVANQISIFDIRKPSKAVYKFAHSGKAKQRFARGEGAYSPFSFAVDMNLNNGRFIAPDAGMGIAGMHWMNNNRILVTGGGDCTVSLSRGGGGYQSVVSHQRGRSKYGMCLVETDC